MARIQINHDFTISNDKLKAELDTLVVKLESKYQLKCNWQSNDCLQFKRSGASGDIRIADGKLSFNMQLGMLLGAFKGAIEKEIRQFMQKNIH